MFVRVPSLPIILILTTCHSNTPSWSKSSYIETWKEQMKEAYQFAFQYSNQRKTKDVIRRNTKRPCLITLEPGDRVLICNLSEKGGRNKMRSYWEEKIYNVTSSIGNDPVVYKIRPEQSKIRTVHRQMLMLRDNFLDKFEWKIRQPASQKHPVQPRTDHKTKKTSERVQDQSQECQSTSSVSDKGDTDFILKQIKLFEWMRKEKKKKPNNRRNNSSNNLYQNEHGNNNATDMKTFQRISRATDEKADQGKTGKVEKRAHYGTMEE